MAREGVDIAVRTGGAQSDLLVARRIGSLRRALYAAPAYLQAQGAPACVADLESHRLIGNSGNPLLNRWALGPGAAARHLVVKGHTRSDNSATVLALALHGVGIARLVDRVADPLVRSGALQPMLHAQIDMPEVPVYAVMLQQRHRLPKIRACIDHLAAWLKKPAPAPHGAPR